jgi:hypothetical protein
MCITCSDICRFSCQYKIFSERKLIIITTFKYTRYVKINVLVSGKGTCFPACYKPSVGFHYNWKFSLRVVAFSLAAEPRVSRPSTPKLTIGHDSEQLTVTLHVRLHAS